MSEERTHREATDWLIRLQEDPGDARLCRQFDVWHAASPGNARAWAEVSDAYDLIGQAATPVVMAMPVRRRSRRAGIAAVAALAAAILLWCLPSLTVAMRADYATAAGEWRSVRLADGSTVELGPSSALDVDFSGAERRTRLLTGRAFFEVTHDPAHPFMVDAQGLRTTVLGTGFDVELTARTATVAVEHGVVQVDYPGTVPVSRRLRAGDWVEVAWTGAAVDGTTAADQVATWRDGQLIVQDQPVSAVVEALRASFPGLILVADGALEQQRVTGVYDLHAPVEALRALAEAHGAQVHRISPWLLVLSPE